MLLGNKGQTAVEYITLLAVVAIIALSVGTKLKLRIIGEADICEKGDLSLKCMVINEILGAGGFGGQPPSFKYFVLRR